MYEKLSGMTGTAMTEAQEFMEIVAPDVLKFQQTFQSKDKIMMIMFL